MAEAETFQAASCMEGPRPEYSSPPPAPAAALHYSGSASDSSGGSYNLDSDFRWGAVAETGALAEMAFVCAASICMSVVYPCTTLLGAPPSRRLRRRCSPCFQRTVGCDNSDGVIRFGAAK